jgi:very-short-patch-repair endonuclease
MNAGTKVMVEIGGKLHLAEVLYNRLRDDALISIGVVLESGYCVDVDPSNVLVD